MAQKLESGPLQIHHGPTDTQVMVQFSRPIPNLILTPKQAEDLIAAIRVSIEKLAAHQRTGEKLKPELNG